MLIVVAFVARLAPVLRGGGLRGILAYDDGVYFGAADALLSGRLPYRDFLLLHPPGVLIVLAPFAGLGRLTSDPVGLAAARLTFMAIGAVNAALVYSVARRAGRVSALTAGAMYAGWGPAVYAERTTLLEPLVNLGVLAALLALGDVRVASRRRLIMAGSVIGAATAMKLWAVVPLVMLTVWTIRRCGRSAGTTFLTASALAAGALCLPFFWDAPRTMVRMVVVDQLGRPDNGVSTWQRLAGIVGHYHAAGGRPGAVVLAATVVAMAFVIAAAAVVATAPQLRAWTALLGAQSAVLLIGPRLLRPLRNVRRTGPVPGHRLGDRHRRRTCRPGLVAASTGRRQLVPGTGAPADPGPRPSGGAAAACRARCRGGGRRQVHPRRLDVGAAGSEPANPGSASRLPARAGHHRDHLRHALFCAARWSAGSQSPGRRRLAAVPR